MATKRRTRTARKRTTVAIRRAASLKGHATRKRRARATSLVRSWYVDYHVDPNVDVVEAPDIPLFPWDRDIGWEPEGGWQGDPDSPDIAFMTHEEKIDFLEYIAEELDTTIHELFEMISP